MSNRRFFVVEVEDCGDCRGSGVVPNKAWEMDEARRDPQTDLRQFWRECAGEGKRMRRVDLAEALEALGLSVEAAHA